MKRALRYLLRKLRRLVERYGIPEFVRMHQHVAIAEYRRCRELGMTEEKAVVMSCIALLRHAI